MFFEQKPYLLSTILALAAPFAASVLGAGEAVSAPTPSACDAIVGNLVTNCGFETTTGWLPSIFRSTPVHSGAWADWLSSSPGGGIQSTAQQTIMTLVPGDSYTLTFWILAYVPTPLDVSFGGTSVLTPTVLPTSQNPLDDTYEEFTTTVTASSTSELLEFDFTGGNRGGYGLLDDVSLVLATPEPASLALFATGLAGLAGLRRRRR
jgi:hypothetical protein